MSYENISPALQNINNNSGKDFEMILESSPKILQAAAPITGDTILHIASANGDTNIIKAITKYAAANKGLDININALNHKVETAYDLANLAAEHINGEAVRTELKVLAAELDAILLTGPMAKEMEMFKSYLSSFKMVPLFPRIAPKTEAIPLHALADK